MKFEEFAQYLRKAHGLNQKDLAKELNISIHSYQRLEYGQQEPRMSTLITLADLYDISLDDLVGRRWPKDL